MGKGKTSIILAGFIALALDFSAVDVFALPMSPGWAGIAGLWVDRIELDRSEEFIQFPETSSCWTIFRFDDVPRPFWQTSEFSDEVRDGLGHQDHHFGKGRLSRHFHNGASRHLRLDAPTRGSVEGGSAPVPEPSTMLLLGSGLIGLAGYLRKSKK